MRQRPHLVQFIGFPQTIHARDPEVAAVLDANEILTVYNLNLAKNGVYGQGLVDQSAKDNRSLYTGVEASFSARLPGGAMMFGSWTMEKNTSVFCESDDNPNGPTTGDLYQGRAVAQGGRFCDQRNFDLPFLHEFKLAGNYTLPLGIDIGAVLQSFGGLERVITWQPGANLFPNAQRSCFLDPPFVFYFLLSTSYFLLTGSGTAAPSFLGSDAP